MREQLKVESRKSKAMRSLLWFLLLTFDCQLSTVLFADTDSRNPTSDEAVSGTWDGSAGSRYTVVDDHPDASGSDFLTHGTTAGNLTFGFSAFSIPEGSTVANVQVIYYDQKTASQGAAAAGRLKVGGNYYNASTHNPANGTWTLRTETWTTNPKSTASWTVNDVNGVGTNALQAFGFFSNDASPTIRISSVIVQVTYTPPLSGPATVPRRIQLGSIGPQQGPHETAAVALTSARLPWDLVIERLSDLAIAKSPNRQIAKSLNELREVPCQ